MSNCGRLYGDFPNMPTLQGVVVMMLFIGLLATAERFEPLLTPTSIQFINIPLE
jgi:hypothetical protein